jgi:hypothetical protein
VRALAREGQGGQARRLRRTLVWAWSLALAGASAYSTRAQAGEAAAPADSAHGFVQLAVAGSDDDAAALVEALRELVGRLGLGLHAARADASPWANGAPATDRDERARVFIDDRFGDRIEITMSAIRGGAPTASVKRSVPRSESTAIVVEQVAYAVHSTLESLLTTGAPPPEPMAPAEPVAPPELNVPPPEPPPVAVVPSPPVDALPARPVRRSGFGLDVAGFASGRGMASGVGLAGGGGVAVDVTAWRGQWRPSLWVAASYNATFGVTDPGIVKLATSVTSLRALPSIELFELSFLQVDLGAGGGVDAFYTVPVYETWTAMGPSVRTNGPTTHWDPVLSGQIVARIRVISGARLLVGFDVDDDLRLPSYTAQNATAGGIYGPGPVFRPAQVRPSAMIGLCVPLVGTAACSGGE